MSKHHGPDAKLLKQIVKKAKEVSRPYRVENGKKFKLSEHDPDGTNTLGELSKENATEMLATGVQTLAALQDRLYAQDRWSLLLVFQAMDAAGKDGVIKHVMSGINPQGCQVHSFKAPSAEDLDHDYMWRCMKQLPERGRIGIFNRSYYEEVLVVRVHQDMLMRQKLPTSLIGKSIWKDRFEDIKNTEHYLARNGVVVVKFFLNVSRKEQKKRFMERIDNPDKNWKFSSSDAKERGYWKEYMKAYQEMIAETASPTAPWYVVPADNKWYTRLVVAGAIIDTLDKLDLHYPEVSDAQKAEISQAKEILEAE